MVEEIDQDESDIEKAGYLRKEILNIMNGEEIWNVMPALSSAIAIILINSTSDQDRIKNSINMVHQDIQEFTKNYLLLRRYDV